MPEAVSGQSADLTALAQTVVAAIVEHPDGAEQALRLVGAIEANTQTLAERTYGEFNSMDAWSEEQRQDYALRAIVGRVVETVAVLEPFGRPAQDAATHLMRETYFARLAAVALSARIGAGALQ
ncbi:hypothetical protein [Methylobacterium sp. WL9]|uniref:hypothetical protein n=1 Tax=Methylobacterium sp. WL9 TaxID=2603898 RepID=UPI0011C84545|nr:hypothetical protein [Methylobacterium sp. WL9]TXN21272.1 hypothetical protein FV217_14850 [Methylobacterium sp. WL9]